MPPACFGLAAVGPAVRLAIPASGPMNADSALKSLATVSEHFTDTSRRVLSSTW